MRQVRCGFGKCWGSFGLVMQRTTDLSPLRSGFGRKVYGSTRRLSMLFFGAVAICLGGSGCESLPDHPGIRVGLSGAGVAVEMTGPEGNGMGARLGIYPVTPVSGELPKVTF